MQGSPLYEYSRKTVGKSQDEGEPKLENLKLANFFWCGDRNRIKTKSIEF
ncbi:thiamine biosynthesis-like protein [Pseudomonas sp. CES]|nr:thiamine biosynthesis-like protein [Pseudomonas sp. CES]